MALRDENEARYESDQQVPGSKFSEPIAVVGFAFNLPQGADTVHRFWDMLMEKKRATSEFPRNRMNIDAFYHPEPNRHDAFPLRGGCFLNQDIGAFDAPFFSINPQEAAAMDPQQRGLLETAYHALENAGIPMEKVVGSKTSVHNGCFSNDYQLANSKNPDLASKYAATGGTSTMLANRVSWFFDLKGPSFNLDSACSSSMMALDSACQCLRSGDSDMGIVSGCNLVFLPDSTALLAKMGFLSPDSRCFSFDHRANGYARGDGFGALIIKRLYDAVQDGDMIRAVIRATGSSQDGRTPGITQPSSESQSTLIRETYAKAGLSLERTNFFEAHATGTAIGDPIEASAIGAAFSKYRSPENPLIVGALKANIGHLEGASGVAGVIKTILALEKGIIPPNAAFEKLNPRIQAGALNLRFPTQSIPWPTGGLRRASVNSFGIGGANSHVVLDDAYGFLCEHSIRAHHCTEKLVSTRNECNGDEGFTNGSMNEEMIEQPMCNGELGERMDPGQNHGRFGERSTNGEKLDETTPLQEPKNHTLVNGNFNGKATPENHSTSKDARSTKLLIWSAMHENGLERLLDAYEQHFEALTYETHQKQQEYLEELAFTLTSRRSRLPWKSYAVVSSLSSLRALKKEASLPQRSDASSPSQGLGFVFTGQGAQWASMGEELMSYKVFRASLLAAERIMLEAGCQWSLTVEMSRDCDSSRIHHPEYSQPLCTALQVALVDLLAEWKVQPSVVVGHSSGEIAAAYCVGALSKEAAIKIAYWRGIVATKSLHSQSSQGAMMSIGTSSDGIQTHLDQIFSQFGHCEIDVACVNSPSNITVSGDSTHIDALKVHLDKQGVFARKLKVGIAYHCPRMKTVAAEYLDLLKGLRHDQGVIPKAKMVSTVTGDQVFPEQLQNAAYWVDNLISPVRFSDALTKVCETPAKTRRKLDLSHTKAIQPAMLLEVGPHSALQGPVRENLAHIMPKRKIEYCSALIRNESALHTMLAAAGKLCCSGLSLDLVTANDLPKAPKMRVDLPKYPFDHSKSYWYETRMSRGYRFRQNGRLDLLGVAVSDWNPLEAKWHNFITQPEQPWIGEHLINGVVVYPGAGMLVMAIEAARQVADSSKKVVGFNIVNAEFLSPLSIPSASDGIETEFYLRSLRDSSGKDASWYQFCLYSFAGGQWIENCRGSIQTVYKKDSASIMTDYAQRYAWLHENFIHGIDACRRPVDKATMYRCLADCGYSYGPSFKPLLDICVGDSGKASANIQTFLAMTAKDIASVQAHVIHPTTFDGILQLNLIGISNGGKDPIPTMVPTRIRKLWISEDSMSGSQSTLRAYTKSAYKGYRGSESSICVKTCGKEHMGMIVEGFESTIISRNEDTGINSVQQSPLCYRIEWKPDVEMLTTAETEAYCKEIEIAGEEPTSFYQKLHVLLMSYITEAEQALRSGLEIAKDLHFQSYISWMRSHIRQSGADKTSVWSLTDKPPIHGSSRNSLASELEASSVEGRFYVTVGRNLIPILRGDQNPLDILFSDDLAATYYREMFSKIACTSHLTRYMGILAHKMPNLKILEVGAGTGGMTAHILSELTHSMDHSTKSAKCVFERYDYTDISASFFPKAKETFAAYRHKMRFEVFDIENDPGEQGMTENEYDVIVAAIVLHATKNIESTLKNLHKLLKPGGKLVLFEIVEPNILRSGFVFGLLPGWWLSEDKARQNSPCITLKAWHHLLSRTGFSGCDLAFQDFESEICHETSVMAATAGSRQTQTPLSCTGASNGILLIDGVDALQRELAEQLHQSETLRGESWQLISAHANLVESDFRGATVVSLVEVGNAALFNLSDKIFTLLKRMTTRASSILWVFADTAAQEHGPRVHLIEGFARSIRAENPSLRFVTLLLDLSARAIQNPKETILRVLSGMMEREGLEGEDDIRQRRSTLSIPRLVPDAHGDAEVAARIVGMRKSSMPFGSGPPLKLTVGTPGLLDTLHFVRDEQPLQPLGPGDIEVEVKASGVNFMDCLAALGQINHSTMGGECAGIVVRAGSNVSIELQPGARVAVCALDTFKTLVRCSSTQAVLIPSRLSFEEAASLPLTFVTVYHALVEVARMHKGESILIHSGAGGTGQAAIQIAKYLGAEIFTTVGTEEKRELLIEKYQISAKNILYSRNTDFAQDIRRLTNERGVDVILNSLSGDGLTASWTECLANFGRFVEIGKKDIYAHGSLPMFQFSRNASFCAVDIASMPAMGRTDLVTNAFRKVIGLVESGVLRSAYPLHRYTISEVEQAFRYMQSGKNTGKMVCTINAQDQVQTVLDVQSTYDFDSQGVYIIAGGLGGLGRSIARWMVSRGAKRLLLLSRSGAKSSAAQDLLAELHEKQVEIETPCCDITSLEALAAVLSTYTSRGIPFRGCIQASMVLKDSIFQNMSYTAWQESLNPKTLGTWNLHSLLPFESLDFFILLSSIAGIFGSPSQANYAAGNTFLDELAHYRNAKGAYTISLDLGAMLSEGVLAENKSLRDRFAGGGHFRPITQAELFALLDYYCNPVQRDTVISSVKESNSHQCRGSVDTQPIMGFETPANLVARGLEEPYWLQRPLFRGLHVIPGSTSSMNSQQALVAGEDATISIPLPQQLASVTSLSDAAAAVTARLAVKLARTVSIPVEDIDLNKPMHRYGIDSLVAVEIRNWFAKEVGADIAVFEILGGESLTNMGVMSAGRSSFVDLVDK